VRGGTYIFFMFVCVCDRRSACVVHDSCLLFFFHFLTGFAKLYFACNLTRRLNNFWYSTGKFIFKGNLVLRSHLRLLCCVVAM